MKYIIDIEQFRTKQEITNRCREIIKDSEYKDVDQKYHPFLLELFKYHPNYYKKVYRKMGIKKIFVKRSTGGNDQYKAFSFFIELRNGSEDDISWPECVHNINPNFNINGTTSLKHLNL